MHFVDDVDLVSARHRRVLGRLKQFAHFIDFGVGRSVNFQQINKSTGIDISTGGADPARLGGDTAVAVSTNTIERLREYACKRRFADTAGTGK